MDGAKSYLDRYLEKEKETIRIYESLKGGMRLDQDGIHIDPHSLFIAHSGKIKDLLEKIYEDMGMILFKLYERISPLDEPKIDSGLEECLMYLDGEYGIEDIRIWISLDGLKKIKDYPFKGLEDASWLSDIRKMSIFFDIPNMDMKEANLANLLSALGALYLLNIYYEDKSFNLYLSELSLFDFGLFSKIFMIEPPIIKETLYEDNIPIKSPYSPYIAKYSEESFIRISKLLADEEIDILLSKEDPIGEIGYKKDNYYQKKKESLLDDPYFGLVKDNLSEEEKEYCLNQDNIDKTIDMIKMASSSLKKMGKEGSDWLKFALEEANLTLFIPRKTEY